MNQHNECSCGKTNYTVCKMYITGYSRNEYPDEFYERMLKQIDLLEKR